ncbi:unnamed protein product [Durusdinium trenchii]|uniref:Poly [ADP-ribose] polymerase tankyrase (DTNKS) (Poly [ADP-ribose] polymerase) (Protein poly-ADP-ribosyltransferase tankyrase) n=2 Tax=Durusdinium trenchii TaxID=1381693 RepID=A0ABP0IMU0_9DINO
MCSCSDAFWSKTIAGTYKLSGSNHGKPIYKRSGPRNILFIYYWDNRDGAHYSGWWFGSSVGGCNVCAFNPDCQKDNPLVPATFGWKVPADGPVDEGFRIIIGGQSCLPTSIQAVTPDVTMITTSNQKFGTVGPAHAADLAEEGKQESTASPENNETVQEMQKSAAVVGERCWESDLQSERRMRIAADQRLANLQEKVQHLEEALSREKRNNQCLECALEKEREQRQMAEKQVMDSEKQHQKMQQLQEDLTTRLEEQKRLSSMASSSGACWQFQENGCWHAVPPEGNDQMTQAYLVYLRDPSPYNRFATINAAGVDREVDFQLLIQKRCDTNKVRWIRILPGAPNQWVSTPACLLQQTDQLNQFYIKVTDSQVHDKVREILQSTGHGHDTSQLCSCMRAATVKSVHRIENLRLWHGYKQRREALRKQNLSNNVSVAPAALDLDAFDGFSKVMTHNQNVFDCGEALAADVDEKILLHGTSWDSANSIVLNGFDHRTCHRGMYGDGVYFASAACKSHQYTCQDHKWGCCCKCERTLIIARVALGDAYYAKETRRNERRPPVRSSTCGVTYDSIVVNPGPIHGHHNSLQVHQEFVICDREQAYPSYVVQYQL